MRNFDGIIFDIDGTLTSTNELIFGAFNHVAEMYLNKRLTSEEIIANFGPTEDVILKEWCGNNYDEGRAEYYKFYSDNHHMAGLYPGMKELLAFVKSKNILTSIYTGKGRDAALITLDKFDIRRYFDFVVTGDDVENFKPSPEGITQFVEKFNLDKERVLMIGDSPVDILASRGAGIKIASVLWDSYAIDEVLKMNTDYIFYTVDELYNFIEKNI